MMENVIVGNWRLTQLIGPALDPFYVPNSTHAGCIPV